MSKRYDLPEANKRYHVFYVGQIPTDMLNLLYGRIDGSGVIKSLPGWVRNVWFNMANSQGNIKLVADIYAANGEKVSNFNSWYMYTDRSALVFCIEDNTKLALNYAEDEIILRVYSNSYWSTGTANTADDFIETKGYRNINSTQITEITNLYHSLNQRTGGVNGWVNGYLVPVLNHTTMAVGDTVELVYDGSIRAIRTFALSTASGFMSERDVGIGKILLHATDSVVGEIEFIDDCDVYVCANVTTPGGVREFGYKVGGHAPSNLRQVTHKAYSVSQHALSMVANNLKNDLEEDYPIVGGSPQILNTNNFFIKVIVRKDGVQQPIVNNSSRIKHLYKLPFNRITEAMISTVAPVDVWKAAKLENSPFIRHLDARYEDLNVPLLRDAFGYNCISKIVGDTPSLVYMDGTSRLVADLPPQLRDSSTVYEYYADGSYKGKYTHTGGDVYFCDIPSPGDPSAGIVEAISGIGDNAGDTKFGLTNIPITPNANFRVYKCLRVGGVPDFEWQDITSAVGTLYNVVNSQVVWIGGANQFLAVRSDAKFLHWEFSHAASIGNIKLTLSAVEDHGSGPSTKILTIPYGQIDVICNGRSLTEGIDYHVDFPYVHIVNKKYMNIPTVNSANTQEFVVRTYGFCNSDMTMDPVEDVGFVKHGLLSVNDTYDLRVDKVLRVTVDGKLVVLSESDFGENNNAISVVHARNGEPYCIKDIMVPIIGFTNTDTHSLRELALETDRQVSGYMTENIAPYNRGDLMSINMKHTLFSPFFCTIITNMVNGVISEASCESMITDLDILDAMQVYSVLYDHDPLNPQLHTDFNFCDVYPHYSNTVADVGHHQYRVLQALVNMFSHGNMVINSHVAIV